MKAYQQLKEMPEGTVVIQEGGLLRLFFDYEKAEMPVIDGEPEIDDMYVCENVDVRGGRDYGDIVSAIVESRYPSDKVQAVMANYVDAQNALSTTDEEKKNEYMQEYSDYQQWRAHAKEIAKGVLAKIGG